MIPYVKESFLTAIPQSPCRDIQPCIVSSFDFSFIVIFIDWQKRGFGLNIPTDLSHYLCFRVSHWVVPHWSVATLFIYEAVIQSLSLHNHSRWVCLSPSIHISCRWHPWIIVCLVHIQSLWLARLTAKKVPLFPLLLLWVVVTQGSFLPQVHHGCFWILHFSPVILCFSCVW